MHVVLTYADSIINLLFLFIKLLPGNFIIYKLYLLSTLANCVCLMILAHLALKLCFLFQESKFLSIFKKKKKNSTQNSKKRKKGHRRERRKRERKRARKGKEGRGGSRKRRPASWGRLRKYPLDRGILLTAELDGNEGSYLASWIPQVILSNWELEMGPVATLLPINIHI